MNIIIGIIFAIIILYLIKEIIIWASKKVAVLILTIVGIIVGLFLLANFWYIVIPVAILLIILYLIYRICKWVGKEIEEENKQKEIRAKIRYNKELISKTNVEYSDDRIDELLYPIVSELTVSDNNSKEYVFTKENMPWGRAGAFLHYFNRNTMLEEPYYFSVIPSKNIDEIREYGFMITRYGMYYCFQAQNDTGKIIVVNESIEFSGMIKFRCQDRKIIANAISKDYTDEIRTMRVPDYIASFEEIQSLYMTIIQHNIGIALLKERLVSDNSSSVPKELKPVCREIKRENILQNDLEIHKNAAYIGTLSEMNRIYKENKNYMDGAQGHGYAAEYANNTIDRFLGRDVINAAQVLDKYGRQVKNGPDRIVNGIQLQTKYYKTAQNTIAAAFQEGIPLYINEDTGKMMSIEVPKDQYNEALKEMERRILNGEVPNCSDPAKAREYIRKGHVTYQESLNVAKAGTIESLKIDLLSGVYCCFASSGISALLASAQSIWDGKTAEEAVETGLMVYSDSLRRGVIHHLLVSQLSRRKLINFMDPSGVATNPVSSWADEAGAIIEKVNIGIETKQEAIGAFASNAFMFGPEIWNVLTGNISVSQMLKNSVVTGISIAGASIGSAVIPIPVVGGVVGSSVSGVLAKKILDEFIEDDAIKMFKILKEEYIEGVFLSCRTLEEINMVRNQTISSEHLSDILKEMYKRGDAREYAKELISEKIVEVIKQRMVISDEMLENGFEKMVERYFVI